MINTPPLGARTGLAYNHPETHVSRLLEDKKGQHQIRGFLKVVKLKDFDATNSDFSIFLPTLSDVSLYSLKVRHQ